MTLPRVLFVFISLNFVSSAAEIIIRTRSMPDRVVSELAPEQVYTTGFYPKHAPPGRYSTAQLDAALAGLAPEQSATLWSETERRQVGEQAPATFTTIDPNGSLHGLDFSGNPTDPETWQAGGSADVQVDVRIRKTRRPTVADFTTREYVIQPNKSGSGGSRSTVNLSVWTFSRHTQIVERSSKVLKYTPSTVPPFFPPHLLADALAGASPGTVVPLASGGCLLDLGIREGATDESVEAYNAIHGIDYIGDPDNHFTWIAIGTSSVMVNVKQETEMGRTFLDQNLQYLLVVPDSNGEVILNPERAVSTHVTDTTAVWDKVYFKPSDVPPQVDPADAAVLAGTVLPGSSGMALHEVNDVPAETTTTIAKSFDAHGAVAGVDYSGPPADPTGWTALTSSDVVVDFLATHTLTTPTASSHLIHQLYRGSSPSGGGIGKLTLVENDVIGREITHVTHHGVKQPLDLEHLPDGITPADVARALAWARQGEQVIVGETRVRTLLSETTEPMPDFIDTNQWQPGVHFQGDPDHPETWRATTNEDVYIDRYHPQRRIRRYDEVVTRHYLTATTAEPGHRQVELTVSGDEGSASREMELSWQAPAGMEFDVETSTDLKSFQSLDVLIKSDGDVSRFLHFAKSSQPSLFLRLRRR